jgi:phosphotransferase system HPr (HPr) family protein
MGIFGPKKTPPIEKEFETKWRIGARGAAVIVRLTSRFRSEIWLSHHGEAVNGKSIMGIMMLGGAMPESEADNKTLPDTGLKARSLIRVTAQGPDAAAAMDALSELFSCGARIDRCIEPGCPSPPILAGYGPDIIHYACSYGHAWAVSRSDASKVVVPSQIAPNTSNSADNISPEEIVELQKKFSKTKSTINNCLAVLMALSEMSQRRPDYSKKLAERVLKHAPQIVSSLQEFTQVLKEKAGPELQKNFSEIKHAINNALAVLMALSEMSQRRPVYSEKVASTVLTKTPQIVSSLQEFAQALNEKAGVKPEVGPKPEVGQSCVSLASLFSAGQIIPEMKATEHWSAIVELIDLLVAQGKIKPEDRDGILASLKEREEEMSTGIGFGIAIPHASSDGIEEVVVAFGRSSQGIDFDALDDAPVKFVVLFIVPKNRFQTHLRALASIAKFLNGRSVRESLAAAKTADEILAIFREAA